MRSPNFNDRRGQSQPDMIVLHYTDMASTQEALERLCDPATEVSAHYLIDESGNILQLVDENKRAWHAGKSWWQGRDDVNSRSIGIEIANKPPNPFTQAQILSTITLCRDLIERYHIPAQNIVGHSDIAPGRKQDPGPLFPWKTLAQAKVGLWPEQTKPFNPWRYFRAALGARSKKQVTKLLRQAGYNIEGFGPKDPSLQQTLHAFQDRFQPNLKTKGRATARSVLILQELINQSR